MERTGAKRDRSQGKISVTEKPQEKKARIDQKNRKPAGPTPDKTRIEHMRNFLTTADERELDSILRYLIQRKKNSQVEMDKKSSTVKRQTKAVAPISQKQATDNLQTVMQRRPKIIRQITSESIAEMEQILFPVAEKSKPRRQKLTNR